MSLMSEQKLPSVADTLCNAVLRAAVGSIAGGAAGSSLHAALQDAMPSRAVIDGTLNLVDVSGGALLGFVLGALWAVEAILIDSGLIARTVRAATSVLGEKRDRAAGERMLADVRISLDKLRRVQGPQGFLLRAALDLGGVTSDPSVARLAEAAEEARGRGGPKTSLSDVLADVIGANLEARLFDARALLLVLGLLLAGSADAVLLLLDSLGR